MVISRTYGVALEHKAALMGIAVQPLARSDSVSDNMKRVVRSSRSCGCLTITAITREFSVIFTTITALMKTGLMSSKPVRSILSLVNMVSAAQLCRLAQTGSRHVSCGVSVAGNNQRKLIG